MEVFELIQIPRLFIFDFRKSLKKIKLSVVNFHLE